MTSMALILLMALLLSVGAQAPGPNSTLSFGPEGDRTALLALRDALDDAGRSEVDKWVEADSPCGAGGAADWPHVRCTAGRVTQLDLSFTLVAGTLPVELRELDALRALNLEGNKFRGGLPPEWGEPLYFPQLEELNLATNELNGTLPNQEWAAEGAWLSLRTLNLARNAFYGGLPAGWAGGAKVFANLRRLDLGENRLGYADEGDAGQLAEQADWCPEGEAAEGGGWCAPGAAGAFARLEHMDLSQNGLRGQLPAAWPALFPRLATLRLQGNALSAQAAAAARPAPLPRGWTDLSDDHPDIFPQLLSLTLYPGNELVCSLPDGQSGSFQDINLDSTYSVESDDGVEYDSANPWVCPGPTADAAPSPTSLAVDPASGSAVLSWRQPDEAVARFVWGYRVTLLRWDVEGDEWVGVPEVGILTARTFLDESYPELQPGLSLSAEGVYTLDLGYRGPGGRFQVQAAAFYTSAQQSSGAALEAELAFALDSES